MQKESAHIYRMYRKKLHKYLKYVEESCTNSLNVKKETKAVQSYEMDKRKLHDGNKLV